MAARFGAIAAGGRSKLRNMSRVKMFVSVIAVGAFIALVALAMNGYVHPAMLIDFANIRICT
jgi:hypothetical protein